MYSIVDDFIQLMFRYSIINKICFYFMSNFQGLLQRHHCIHDKVTRYSWFWPLLRPKSSVTLIMVNLPYWFLFSSPLVEPNPLIFNQSQKRGGEDDSLPVSQQIFPFFPLQPAIIMTFIWLSFWEKVDSLMSMSFSYIECAQMVSYLQDN